MVKMQAVQSAIAIRRQRSRREAKKMKERRESKASVLSTPRPSVVSLEGRVYFDDKSKNKRMFGQVTMFQVGGVLIIIGLMLVITSFMPGYIRTTSTQQRNDLLGTGSFFVFVGGVLSTISRFVSNSEEEELNNYIRGRLSRSRSSHRLGRDVECGVSTPSKERKQKPTTNGLSHVESNLPSGEFINICITDDDISKTHLSTTSASSEISPDYIAISVDSPMSPSVSTEPVLSKIIEEEEIDMETDASTEQMESSTPESSLSPTSPLETQGLLEKRYSRCGSKGPCKNMKIIS